MEQKIISVGNSLAVVIPQVFRKQIGFKAGDSVIVDKKGKQITISSIKKADSTPDIRFAKMLDEFIKDHEDVLQKLAKR